MRQQERDLSVRAVTFIYKKCFAQTQQTLDFKVPPNIFHPLEGNVNSITSLQYHSMDWTLKPLKSIKLCVIEIGDSLENHLWFICFVLFWSSSLQVQKCGQFKIGIKTTENTEFRTPDTVKKILALFLCLFWYINQYNPTCGCDVTVNFIDLTTLRFVKKPWLKLVCLGVECGGD